MVFNLVCLLGFGCSAAAYLLFGVLRGGWLLVLYSCLCAGYVDLCFVVAFYVYCCLFRYA